MKKTPNLYPCPACGVEFTAVQARTNNKSCPACNVPVEPRRKRHPDHKGFYYIYVLADPQSDKLKDLQAKIRKPPLKSKHPGKLISGSGVSPEVYQIDGKREYEVIYRDKVYTGWLYCPGCNRKMFQNTRVMSPVHVEQSHKCRNNQCGAIVKFKFIRSMPMMTS